MEEIELEKDMITQLVRVIENYPENAKSRIMRYKDTILRPLEVMAPIAHTWIHAIIETKSSYAYAWCVGLHGRP